MLLDAGSLFGLRNQEEKNQTGFLCEHTAKLGYTTFGLGEWDLNYGLQFLRDMEKQHGFEWINANVRGEEGGPLLFPPYKVEEIAGLRVGLISVLSPQYKIVTMSAEADNFVLDSPRDALDRWLPELQDKSDLIILLAQLSSKDTRELPLDLGDQSGIDIAVEGHDARQYRRINKVGNTYLLAANNQGKYVGQMDLLLNRHGDIQDATLTMHALDNKSPEVEEIQKAVDKFKAENKGAGNERASLVHPRPEGSPSERFLGAANCAQCHTGVYRDYVQTAHARAWDSLVTKGQASNPECISCHVVGFNHQNGFDRVADPRIPGREALKNVQCEACHGYGTEHDRTGDWLAQARESCTVCHDQQNSPNFDYDTYWAKIAH